MNLEQPSPSPGSSKCDTARPQHHDSDDSDAAKHADVRIGSRQGFQDATAMLFSACDDLRLGQMVAVPNFSLMDSMAAVKIMDARMDSGMDLPASELPESDRIEQLSTHPTASEFDPFQPLNVHDVLWIMDRLLACEAAWHQGSALSQTLYTCLYFHSIKSLSPKHPRFQHAPDLARNVNLSRNEASSHDGASPSPRQLVYKVLRAFILATVKTIDIAWSELASKQHLHDGEDYSSDKNGLSLLESTHAGYVVSELEDALDWLHTQTNLLSQSQIDSLRTRLSFRKQMLYAVVLLQNPAESAPLDVVMHAKFAQRSWALIRPSSATSPAGSTPEGSADPQKLQAEASTVAPLHPPNRSAAPSSAAVSAFDPAYSRRLAWCQALRPISLPSASDTWRVLDGILQELQQVVYTLQQPGFLSWKTYFTYRASQYQTRQPFSATPYVRSLLQTAVCDRNMIASRLPLDWLGETFFQEVALVDPLLLRRASRIDRSQVEGGSKILWNASPPLGQRVHFFMQRVSGQLVHYLQTLSQNRSRCKRTLASKLYREWVHIAEEASSLGRQLEECLAPAERYLPDSLFATAQHLALEIMSQIVFSGFELDLYTSGMDCQAMWWLAGRVQVEQIHVCSDLLDELTQWLQSRPPQERPRKHAKTTVYLSRQVHLAQALEQLVHSTIYLSVLFHRGAKDGRRSELFGTWPPNLQDESASLELAKSIFLTRVKWMRGPASASGGTGSSANRDDPAEKLWQDFRLCFVTVEQAKDTDLKSTAREHLDQAIQHLEHLKGTFDDHSDQELGTQYFGESVTSLLATAYHNCSMLKATRSAAGKPDDSQRSCVFEHPWIPKWI